VQVPRLARMARTMSIDELAASTGATTERIQWLVRIGILDPARPHTFTAADAFRVKMIESLLAAGFAPEQVEAAVSGFGMNLRHIDRYVIHEPGEPSDRTFAEFTEALGSNGRIVPAMYQMLGLSAPDPASHLPTDEEELVRAFVDAWRLAVDSD